MFDDGDPAGGPRSPLLLLLTISVALRGGTGGVVTAAVGCGTGREMSSRPMDGRGGNTG